MKCCNFYLSPSSKKKPCSGIISKLPSRNLWKIKGYSVINIFGHATGIGACLLILFYVADELGYDQ